MKSRQRLIDGDIPFRVARDLTPKIATTDTAAIAAALFEVLPDSLDHHGSTALRGWLTAGRLEAISRHPKYGRKQVPR